MVFEHLSDEEVIRLYNQLKADGLSEDDIFTEIYSVDCSQDEDFE